MFDIAKPRVSSNIVSIFLTPNAPGDSRFDIWTGAGRELEPTCCTPLPIGLVVRTAIALALVVAAQRRLAGALP